MGDTMMMVVRRKPVDLNGWHLHDQSAMLDALSVLSQQGWRGGLSFDPSNGLWRIELNADNPTRQVTAQTGDWLVDDMGLRALTAAELAEHYDEAE